MMSEYEVQCFEKSVDLTEQLFEFLKQKGLNISKNYTISMARYEELSELGNCCIKLNSIKGFKNNSIEFGSYFYENGNKMYKFHLWKYNGDHFFKDYGNMTYEECKDFELCYQRIQAFFGHIVEQKVHYEQLKLF